MFASGRREGVCCVVDLSANLPIGRRVVFFLAGISSLWRCCIMSPPINWHPQDLMY